MVERASGDGLDSRAMDREMQTKAEGMKLVLEMTDTLRLETMREVVALLRPPQLAVYTNNYSCELGSGGYGVVYKGELPNGLLVGAKVLKVSRNKKVQEAFMAEIGTIGRTYHVHLVRLYGFCFDANTKALVYEFLENGSLEKGSVYLHEECQQRIVHYDIKPANILLTADYTPKVADFGLARLGERENTHMSLTGGGRGMPGYAAPELWMALPASEKCDVYSFRMVLFEILGWRRNYDPGHGEKKWFPRRLA
ncbi:unnamed protein product [Miscanthus lutarioriparius]|uniref:Protein kinase domain-containing protein n=1 Tax=Miscanthus lutarioriparius TaxID=422564 RepID=A0A811NRW5_9POAL|nr:unnamed protein product [Miscanthus lutarioriparius]